MFLHFIMLSVVLTDLGVCTFQLYTLTTIVLVLQVIYYDHFLSWWKKGGVEVFFPEVS